MAGNNYTIELQAKINEATFATYVQGLANKYTIMLKGALSQVAGATTATAGATSSAAGAVNSASQATTTLQAKIAQGQQSINDKIAEWNRLATPANEIFVQRNNLTGQAIRATNTFTDAQKKETVEQVTLNENTGKFTDKISKLEGGISNASQSTRSWTANIVNNIGKVIQWALATAAIYGSLKKLQEGVIYVSALNKALIDAQIVTGMTQSAVDQLGNQYNILAKELGATTLQVADASIEFLRQGKTIQETQELVRMSVMMSKLANMESAASTEALTAIMNGFQLKVKDLMPVLDSLVELDNSYASSVGKNKLPKHAAMRELILDKTRNLCYNY